MYCMWNESFENLRGDFKRNDGEIKNRQNFLFNIDGRVKVGSFRIEQLDFLTSLYKDEKSFIEELSKDEYQGHYIEDRESNKPITITISNKKSFKIKNVPVIYNDKFITEITSEIRMKKLKKNGKNKKSDIILDSTEDLIDFVEYVKTLAMNEVSRKYLINPIKRLKEVSIEDRYVLNNVIRDDIELNNGKVKRGLKSILSEYIGYKTFYEERKNAGQSTLELDENLKAINDELLMYFKRDYHNIREVIVWENKFKMILENQLENKNCINRDEVENCLNYINFQKEYRNDRMDKDEWDYYQYEFFNGKVEPIKMQRDPINNEKMLELFNEGGIAAVLEGMDADEIYKSESDARSLGIIKRR